jgi:hypothetical protein
MVLLREDGWFVGLLKAQSWSLYNGGSEMFRFHILSSTQRLHEAGRKIGIGLDTGVAEAYV